MAAPVHADGAAGVLKTVKVMDGVYAFAGPLGDRDADNLGNNATFGAVTTAAGVVLIDPGGSAKGAAMLDAAVQAAIGKPVVMVINTGGQDHRWVGNGYFKAKGVTLAASAAAVADQKKRANDQLLGLESRLGAEGLAGTEPVPADPEKGDRVFESALNMTVGGVDFLIRNVGPAHTPGDSFVWVPGKRIVFTGDIVYVERMLGVIPVSRTASWLESFDALASLGVVQVVPGHGSPATLGQARAETREYLAHLRAEVRKVLDAGGGIEAATAIDQSAFSHLKNFDTLSRRNAQATFIEMEFE